MNMKFFKRIVLLVLLFLLFIGLYIFLTLGIWYDESRKKLRGSDK